MKKSMEERIEATMKKVREGDPILWRHPLAEATVSLLQDGEPVTVESLIERLEVTGTSPDVLIRGEVSKAAIDRLRQIVVKND
ncbi:hypothetical protein C8J31_102123 [Rhizobium sp. PP-CC-2G-626]|nr:hypothetical protein C8J31_102123 [Rhizobium sp. PP-CC-2G-626]